MSSEEPPGADRAVFECWKWQRSQSDLIARGRPCVDETLGDMLENIVEKEANFDDLKLRSLESLCGGLWKFPDLGLDTVHFSLNSGNRHSDQEHRMSLPKPVVRKAVCLRSRCELKHSEGLNTSNRRNRQVHLARMTRASQTRRRRLECWASWPLPLSPRTKPLASYE